MTWKEFETLLVALEDKAGGELLRPERANWYKALRRYTFKTCEESIKRWTGDLDLDEFIKAVRYPITLANRPVYDHQGNRLFKCLHCQDTGLTYSLWMDSERGEHVRVGHCPDCCGGKVFVKGESFFDGFAKILFLHSFNSPAEHSDWLLKREIASHQPVAEAPITEETPLKGFPSGDRAFATARLGDVLNKVLP